MLSGIRRSLPPRDQIREMGKEVLLTGSLDLPDNKVTFTFRLIKQVILFIYFLIQLIYPIIAIALDRENYGYNITCSAISLLALLSQFFDIPDLLRNAKKLYHCCRNCSYESEVELCDCCEGDKFKKCVKHGGTITGFISEVLVFPSVICSLIGFINERTWELDNGLDYFDLGLFALGLFSDLVLVKGKGIWKYLVSRYIIKIDIQGKGKRFARGCCCDPLNVLFCYLILREFMHISMFGMVSCKLYADNFSNKDDPEEGNYTIEGFTWYTIVATWYMPTVSFIYFMFINVFLFYRTAYLLTNEENDDSDVYVSTDLLFCSCLRNPFAIVLIYIVLPTYFAFNIGATTQYEGIPSAVSTTWVIFQIIFNITFIIAHIQALLFHFLLCQFPCVYCFMCFCTNAGKHTNTAIKKV